MNLISNADEQQQPGGMPIQLIEMGPPMKQKKKDPMPIKNKFICLNLPINEKTSSFVIKEIIDVNQYNSTLRKDKKKVQWINLIINSPGGSVYSTLGIIDIMKSSEIPIRTIGTGLIASGATMLFIAGKERILYPSATFMIHQVTHWMHGKDHEIDSLISHKNILNKILIDHYVEHSKITKKEFEKILFGPTDKYLTPKDVKKYGMCDKIDSKLNFT